jgi:hypothetical protein
LHYSNFGHENYGQKLLMDFMALRGVLIRQLVEMGAQNFKVMDSLCTTSCTRTANTNARLDVLRVVTKKDGIHFTSDGYKNLAKRCTVCIKSLLGNMKKEHKNGNFC